MLSETRRRFIPLTRVARRESADSGVVLQRMCFALPFAATLYSAGLAFLSAQGLPGSYALVVLVEVVLLALAVATLLANGLRADDWSALLMLFFLVAVALTLSMVNNRLMLEALRSTFLIGIFALLGQRMTARTLDALFLWVGIIVLVVLLLEIFVQPVYVTLFQPQQFFSATRGIQATEYNNSGLFNNAGSFEGRFSFGIFDVPRTSSVFMEQVSNANFACILALYISARWSALAGWRRALLMLVVALILVSTNGRFAAMLIAVLVLGYFVFPFFGRLFMPLVSMAIATIAIGIMMAFPDVTGDSLTGRINFVGEQFAKTDVTFFMGGRALENLGQRDSGYSYLIGTTSIFGAVALWAFINFYPRADDAPSRRLAFGTAGYMLGQLLVSSTSLFSIKTAVLLWAMVGCVRAMPPVSAVSRQTG